MSIFEDFEKFQEFMSAFREVLHRPQYLIAYKDRPNLLMLMLIKNRIIGAEAIRDRRETRDLGKLLNTVKADKSLPKELDKLSEMMATDVREVMANFKLNIEEGIEWLRKISHEVVENTDVAFTALYGKDASETTSKELEVVMKIETLFTNDHVETGVCAMALSLVAFIGLLGADPKKYKEQIAGYAIALKHINKQAAQSRRVEESQKYAEKITKIFADANFTALEGAQIADKIVKTLIEENKNGK